MRAVVTVCALASAAAGCALVFPDRTAATDGGEGPDALVEASPGDGPASDGNPDADGSVHPDGGIEMDGGDSGDAMTTTDGPLTDVGTPDAVTGPSWCSKQDAGYILCDDFDESGALSDIWTDASSPSWIVINPGPPDESPPNSLEFNVPTNPSMAAANVQFVYSPAVSTVDVWFDVWPVNYYSSGKPLYVVGIQLNDGVVGTLYANEGITRFQQTCAGCPTDLTLTSTIPTGKWTTVHLHLSVASNNVSVTLDGTSDLDSGIDSQWAAGWLLFYLGNTDATEPDPYKMYYDNVVVYAQ